IERFAEDNDDMGSFGTTNSHSENSQLSWRNTLSLNVANTLVFGVDLQEQELEYSSFGAVQTDTARDNHGIFGVFLHDGSAADLTISLRNDDNEHFGNHATGSIALGRDFNEDFRGWLSYGTAFKAPNLIDLYVDFPSFFYFANPDLEPETSENLELGLQGNALGMQWQLNVFRNEIEDLIASDATFTTLANVQEARINGIEATIAAEIADWQLSLALTALDHENRSTGNELLRRPDQTVSLNLAREFGDFDLALNVLAQSDHADIDPVSFGNSTVAGYATANLVAGYRISAAMNLRLRIGNLFDRDYQIVDGFNTYGRTAQLSFDYRF
ncbi:MAG: TonB-dependent receptor, partial [Pseudohongiellaceae bacterium]